MSTAFSTFLQSVLLEAAIDGRIPSGVLNISDDSHRMVIAEKLLDRGIDPTVVLEVVNKMALKDGKYPDPGNPYELGREVPIPTGDVDFPAVIAELKKQGFKGAITIECELNGTRHDYVIQTRKYLQELLER